HTNSRDEALALPSEESVQIALRTQQIIAYESGVADTVDPLAGSYYVESLTNQIERAAADYIRRIDEMGGAIAAIERGFIQKEIEDSAYKYQRALESGEQTVVGLNKFQIKEAPPKGLLKVDPAVGELQRKKLAHLRASRDADAVSRSLDALKRAAEGDTNLIPFILDAVKAYATLGEICDTLRGVFGEYKPSGSL
ncbi:MAG: methylmalonyl-CoA mutase family protein, partial [Firmicutes bacterium]|nr:methylmalonyl-CoA mutase family protein [Bacillota bacterium]